MHFVLNTHQILESHLNIPGIVSNTLVISTEHLKDVEVQSLRSSRGSLDAHVALLNHSPSYHDTNSRLLCCFELKQCSLVRDRRIQISC
jgi:hypothetical protein